MLNNNTLASYPCPACSGTILKSLYKIKDFNVVQCHTCSMVFVNPRIKNSKLYNMYTDKYFRNEENGYEDYELTAHLRIKTFRKWYTEIEPFLKTTGGRALDIGCAAGYFLQILAEQGWETEGIELENEMLACVREKGYHVYNTPLEYFNEDNKYNLITLFDVIEHLPNLHSDIKKLANILDKNGTIALVTPNFNSMQRKIFGKRWFQFKPREHIQYFTQKTLQKAVEQHGLTIVHNGSSGQYADTSFLHNRLQRYGFSFAAQIFNICVKILGLTGKSWYANTGSMLTILQIKG